MTGTTMVPRESLREANRILGGDLALCPACPTGRLYPHVVTITVSHHSAPPFHEADYLTGWVAVCVGNADYRNSLPIVERSGVALTDPCGFAMGMTPHLFPNRHCGPVKA